ncbi:hypothetical protein ACBQ16_06840 [Halopseudomonas bauzanensis]|uniref:hypothetical protein n=1 Tax=Halopseudomonas bauzanensis TaxID=653930 RepID=UPI0035253D98
MFFFEKPRYGVFAKPIFNLIVDEVTGNEMLLVTTHQVLHHQLRLSRILRFLNGVFEVYNIRSALRLIKKMGFAGGVEGALVVNFNYDYFFLPKAMRRQAVDFTILNDDFVAQARLFKGAHVKKSIDTMARKTKVNLAVSYPILKSIDRDNKAIFLPWADGEFKFLIKTEDERNKVLFWGHIDRRVDFELVRYIASSCPEFIFDFVGPVADSAKVISATLERDLENVVFSGVKDLSEININRYFCSIIPYKSGVADIEAVTASNKTFRILSYGLPLITYGMPSFIECPVVFKSASYADMVSNLKTVNLQIYDLQNELSQVVSQNTEEARYRFLMDAI